MSSSSKILNARDMKRFFLAFPHLLLEAKNTRVNGITVGCTGFVTNPLTGKCAYFNTESITNVHVGGYLLRTAKNTKDYSGGVNQFIPDKDGFLFGLEKLVR